MAAMILAWLENERDLSMKGASVDSQKRGTVMELLSLLIGSIHSNQQILTTKLFEYKQRSMTSLVFSLCNEKSIKFEVFKYVLWGDIFLLVTS